MLSKIEFRDLLISVLVLSFAFYRALGIDFITSIIVITLAFVLHELSHRYIARRYGCFAEYRMWPLGILLALLSSFTGIIFAAPGAVYISPFYRKDFAFRVVHLTKKEYGKISLAGPLTNIIIGLASFLLFLFYGLEIFFIISHITLFLALFNLLPFFPLDGSKVFAWNRKIWLTSFVIAFTGIISLSLI